MVRRTDPGGRSPPATTLSHLVSPSCGACRVEPAVNRHDGGSSALDVLPADATRAGRGRSVLAEHRLPVRAPAVSRSTWVGVGEAMITGRCRGCRGFVGVRWGVRVEPGDLVRGDLDGRSCTLASSVRGARPGGGRGPADPPGNRTDRNANQPSSVCLPGASGRDRHGGAEDGLQSKEGIGKAGGVRGKPRPRGSGIYGQP